MLEAAVLAAADLFREKQAKRWPVQNCKDIPQSDQRQSACPQRRGEMSLLKSEKESDYDAKNSVCHSSLELINTRTQMYVETHTCTGMHT